MVDINEKQKTVRRPIVSLRRRQMLVTTLLGAVILVSGIGIGFGSAMAYLGRAKEVATVSEPPQQPTKVAITFTKGLADKYGLDQQQTGQLKDIMTKRFKALHEIRIKAMDEMVAIHREIADDMRSLMKPDQFERWEKHNEAARKRSKFRRPWGRPRSQRGDREWRGRHNGRGGPYGQGKSYSGGMPDMFKRMDKDNNGELTEDEIKKVPGPFQQLIQKADVNGDGKVDRKEYEAQFRRRRPRTMPGRDRKPRERKDPSSAPAPELSML